MQPDQVWIFQRKGQRYRLTEQQILDLVWHAWFRDMVRAREFDRLTHDQCIEDFVLQYEAHKASDLNGWTLDAFRPTPLRVSWAKMRQTG